MDVAKTVLEFIVFTVVVKAILAHWIAEQIIRLAKWAITLTPRQQSIWEHFQLQAQGKGHAHDDVTICGEGACAIFKLTI